jgi:acetylornithine aminotransferase/acetylornithine/N-succinyldiaminopimelate aminotransferase
MSLCPDLSATPTRELFDRHVLGTYGRFDLEIRRGSGTRVWDEHDNAYLDFGAGIAVCSLGHCHPAVTEAVTRQAGTLVHTSNLYYTRPQAELGARIGKIMEAPGRVFFCNSGAEANEGLIKASRRYGAERGGRFEMITFAGSFHGRTMAGISATGQDKVKIGFAPLLPGFVHVPFGDLAAVEAAITPATVGILVEPVQGEGGIHIGTPGFLQGLRALCDDRGLLLFFDEVQCGLGRTGDWCGWHSLVGHTVSPDGVSWAKGIANGYPLGAFWLREETVSGGHPLAALLGPGSHGTTYGGNPVCCAAALAVFDTIEREGLLTATVELGAFLREELRALPGTAIREVRALGLMIGIELDPDFGRDGATPALTATKAAMAHGLLVIPAGEKVIRLLPPLNVTKSEIAEAVRILSSVLTRS